MSTIEIRNTTFSESQDPPLVYVSRAEADINQKLKEDPAAYDMMPGTIESAIVIEPVGSGGASESRSYGGWSIVDDERKKPHEAIFLPLEPLATNEASVLRFSLHQTSAVKFKSLIGRFRISYTQDDRIRELMLPAQSKLWSSIGPFPAQDVTKAYATAFEPEKDIKNEPLDLKKSYTKVVLPPASKDGAEKPAPAATPAKPAGDKTLPRKKTRRRQGRHAPGRRRKVGAASGAAPSDGKPPSKKGAGEVGKKPIGAGRRGRGPEARADGQARPRSGQGEQGQRRRGPRKSLVPKRQKRARRRRSPKPRRPRARRHRRPTRPSQSPRKSPGPSNASGATALPARLQGANSAYYLTRKIVSTRPRTAIVQIDGPAGFRMWVNGELAQTSLPPPPAAPPKGADAKATGAANGPDAKNDEKAEDDKEEPVVPEINDANFDETMGRGRNNPEKKFRIGLRQGENEIVVKAVFGGGASPNGRRGLSAGGEMARGNGGGLGRRLVHIQYHAGGRRRPDS